MNSRQAAEATLGHQAVRHYEQVKAFYTRYGHALEEVYAYAVGGRLGTRGEADVITPLGAWEFCTGANTKNAAGDRAQLEKVGAGHIVQVNGEPRTGRISGPDFLELHGVQAPATRAADLAAEAMRKATAPPTLFQPSG